MAGRRQHYIPRFLQMGFISRQKKKQFYTFVYHKNREPFECNLTNVGLENDFYGNPQECEADENITKSETIYFKFIESLRKIGENTDLNAEECSAFLSHMYIRGKSTRTSIQEMGETFYSASKNKIRKFPDQKAFFLHLVKTNRKEIAKQLLTELPSNLNNLQKMLLTKHCLDKPEAWIEQVSGKDLSGITSDFDQIIQNIPNISKESHYKALEECTTSTGVTQKLKLFNWHLLCHNESDYIFGDVGPICWNDNEGKFKKLIFINNEISNIFMPISKNQLLTGNKESTHRKIPNVNEVNEAIAKLSREFFICPSNGSEIKKISKHIGKEGDLVGEEEKLILEKVLNPLTPRQE